jgi:hypothetical protein
MAELGAYDIELMDADSGKVDLFGLDEFGSPNGMNPLWGAIIGGGLGTGTAIAVRALAGAPAAGKFDWKKYSEGIGFAVGAATSGLMIAFEGTRAAGWAGLAVAFMTNGLRQLESMFMEKTAMFGAATIEPLNGVTTEFLSPGTRDVGLGVADVQYVPEAYGTIPGVYGTPVAGTQMGTAPPVDLMAAHNLPANSYQVELMGGPALSGLSAHYGATLFGSE